MRNASDDLDASFHESLHETRRLENLITNVESGQSLSAPKVNDISFNDSINDESDNLFKDLTPLLDILKSQVSHSDIYEYFI